MGPAANDDRLPEIAPDDPRLSEWIDGRLSGPEAAAVDRAVAASPELTRLVADLRGLKQTLGRLPATTPDAGFVRDAMAAIAAADERAEDLRDDLRVDAEWHKVEEERIALERAEAGADALDAPRTPRRWRWLPMAGALAAGLLVAAALNLGRVPGGRGDRTVALAPRQEAESHPAVVVPPPDAATPADEADRSVAALEAVEQTRPPEATAETGNRLREGRADVDSRAITAQPAPPRPAAAGRGAAPAAPATGPATANEAAELAATAAAAPPAAGVASPAADGGAAGAQPTRSVLVVRVTGPGARERLQTLIRDRGATCLPIAPPGGDAVLSDPGTVFAETGRIAVPDAAAAKAELGPAGEFDFLEITAPAPTIEALVDVFSGRDGLAREARAEKQAARALAVDAATPAPAGAAADAEAMTRLLIRIVDLEAPTAKAEQGAAGESP